MSKARVSPHFRFYGTQISIKGSGKESAEPSEEALRMIAELAPYLEHDDGAFGTELCTIVHEAGRVCVKLRGHA